MTASTPHGEVPPTPPADLPGRPCWSASEAARRCGVGRATIQRALTAGRIVGAVETEKGWSIPLDGLLGAGFTPDRPNPPGTQSVPSPGAARKHDRAPLATTTEQDRRIAELERDVAAERARADLEHAHRLAAEQLAAERAERVADLRHTLRMIEAGPAIEQPEPTDQQPPVLATRQPRRAGLLGWMLNQLP